MGTFAGAPLEKDEALVETALQEIPRPDDVRAVSYETGEDSDGNPSIWIWLATEKNNNPSPDLVRRLTAYSTEVRDWLLDHGVKRWPYVRIQDYKPSSALRRKNVAPE